MKAIIIEDEFYPRETLKQKLAENHPDIQVVATCENAENGLIEILRQQPDLLFLDIQLPEKNGLWLAEQLHTLACETFAPPSVIFTTAYTDSHYLLEAFRLSAVDYLVKPIQIEGLKNAIEKVKKNRAENLPPQSLSTIFDNQKLLKFKNFGGLILLKAEDIAYIEADGNYAILYLASGEKEDIFERLGEIEKRLPAEIFVRADRSIILNRTLIRQINTKKSIVTLAAQTAKFDVKLSENGIKILREK
ncbi:MAG: LytTR family DNA-binding domain-containing protein [Prevotellaceae bacterium]|jgi:two-component system LytT family response regulator|nr:LytTR family DNA-binding domain-containing protein [Prevotellaceae bacterium]